MRDTRSIKAYSALHGPIYNRGGRAPHRTIAYSGKYGQLDRSGRLEAAKRKERHTHATDTTTDASDNAPT